MVSEQASAREVDVYSIGVPARFRLPPDASAPLPDRLCASYREVSAPMRHNTISTLNAATIFSTKPIRRACVRDALNFNPRYGAGEDGFAAMQRLIDRKDPGYRT
jgi:hypothetical protein